MSRKEYLEDELYATREEKDAEVQLWISRYNNLYKQFNILMNRMQNLSAMLNASYHPLEVEFIIKWLDETLDETEKIK